MCRFFTTRNLIKTTVFASIAIPLTLTIAAYQRGNSDLGFICANWLIGASVALISGYYLHVDTRCPLPHLPENVNLEPSQIEGEQYAEPVEVRQSVSISRHLS